VSSVWINLIYNNRIENYRLSAWFVRLIPSLILLERLLQLVHLVLTLSSIWIARVITLLITTSVFSGAIACQSNSMLTGLLRYTLDKLTIVLSIALVEIVSECVWYNWCNLYLFIYLEVFLELYLICIIYYKFWRLESGWCSLLQLKDLSAGQWKEPCIGLTQENSIKNSVQDCLSYILVPNGPCKLFLAYPKWPCIPHIV